MIVAYVSPHDTALRAQVESAVEGEPLAFRDPALFTLADADPLDHVVYVSRYASHIRDAYRNTNAQFYDLDETPLVHPGVPFLERRRRQQAEALRTGVPVDRASIPNVPAPTLTNPAQNRLEGVRRVGRGPALPRAPMGRLAGSAAAQTEAMQRYASQAGDQTGPAQAPPTMPANFVVESQALPGPDAPVGVVRPNSSARAQTTSPEVGAPVTTIQKPASAPARVQGVGVPAAPMQTPNPPLFSPQGETMSEPTSTPKPTGPPTPADVTPKSPETPKVGEPPKDQPRPRPTTTDTPKP